MNLADRTLAALESLNGTPDRESLLGWPGWGPLAPALAARPDGKWVTVADRLDELVPAAELNVARDIVDTSFYTSPAVIDAVYALLRASGFTRGRVLEPGCGAGHFMSRTPADMTIDWVGVEIDQTAARFARALNPAADVICQPLQKTVFRTGEFDAVIGNVPFSSSTVFDPAYVTASLHEYFILRALDAVRPGGYVISVTSRHALDGQRGLDQVLEEADLLSAVRLPSGAFEGTDVVADILVLRKRGGLPSAVSGWTFPTREVQARSYWASSYTEPAPYTVTTGEHTCDISGVWTDHLDCIAGTPIATGFDRAPLKVLTDDISAAIERATDSAARFVVPGPGPRAVPAIDDVVLADAGGRKTGSFHLIDGVAHEVIDGRLQPMARASAELKALIPLRDAAVRLITLEGDPRLADAAIEPARAAARALYETYVAKFGPLNRGTLLEGKLDADTGEATWSWRRPSMGGFRRDPDYVSVLALESFDPDTGEASPAPILLHRVGHQPEPATHAESAAEALTITLGEGAGVDLGRISQLLGGAGTAEVLAALGDLVYRDPAAAGAPVIARAYLSGNVRVKLAIARTAAASDQSYQRNVTALEAVHPAELGPTDIRVQLGATWISAAMVEQFAQEVFGAGVSIKFEPAFAHWEVESTYARASAEARLEYGTDKMAPHDLLAKGLNSQAPVIWEEQWDGFQYRKVRNQSATLAAEEKLRLIQERFGLWVWEDADRAVTLLAEYNRRFNSTVVRRGDGSYLTFPAMDKSIELWPWQRDAVDRVVSSERVVIGHPVGAGKTLSMIAAAMTLRRFKLASKPMIVVPNHLLEQIAREAAQAYPTGKFLIATKDDLTRDRRRLFAARCATGDWDAVVITHQAFTSIPVDPTVETDWLETKKAELRSYLQGGSRGGNRGAKQVANAVRKLEERIESLRHNTGDCDAITFDQLGVDHVSVDEVQYFRRLLITTRADGFSLGSSKRATDLLLKVDTLGQRYPGKPIVAFYTGTLWSNTLAETYVWQRFLQPDRLVEAGVAQFDAWAATFVRYETRIEVTPDGNGFRLYRRPSVIQNVPELRLMLAEVADLLTADSIGLERPRATWENVLSQPTPKQREFVTELAARADAIRTPGAKPKRPGGGDDNMLIICNDGRQVALDPQLVGIDEHSVKVEAAAQNIARNYHRDAGRIYGASPVAGTFQLVLCDVGTPHPGDPRVYGRLRRRLIKLGVPADGIRFIHDATTDKARTHLFALCREGAVSVLVGSTDKVGVGTNIQTRLSALHHLDAPWRPADIEQREGRALRPKNLNAEVMIYRYLAEGTFDAFMWQTLERKARFIAQMYADGAIREFEDVGDAVLTYGEVKALAAGNPDLLRQAELMAEVRRLRTIRSMWRQNVNHLRDEAESSTHHADAVAREHKRLVAALAVTTDSPEPGVFQRLAEGILAGRSTRAGWRGLSLNPARARGTDDHDVRVAIEHLYYSLFDIVVPAKTMRRTPEVIAAFIERRAEDWLAGADPNRLLGRIESHQRNAAAADAAASASIFDGEFELAAAERDLARVDAAIANSVAEAA